MSNASGDLQSLIGEDIVECEAVVLGVFGVGGQIINLDCLGDDPYLLLRKSDAFPTSSDVGARPSRFGQAEGYASPLGEEAHHVCGQADRLTVVHDDGGSTV